MSERPQRSLLELGRVVLALLSVAAGAIHFAVTGEHFNEFWGYGVFFLVVAWLQVIWAIMVVTRPSRPVLVAAVVGNLVVAVVWVVSRTVGIPVGPEAGVPETASLVDVLATVFEVAIAGGCLVLLGARPRDRSVGRATFAASGVVMALLVVPLTSAALVADARDPGHHGAPGAGMTHMDDEDDHHDEAQGASEHEESDEGGLDEKGTRSVRASSGGTVEALLEPARPGPNRLHLAFVDEDGMEEAISSLTVHAIAEGGTGSKVRVERLGPGHFVGRMRLDHGDWLFHMIARTKGGGNVTAEFEQHVDEPHS